MANYYFPAVMENYLRECGRINNQQGQELRTIWCPRPERFFYEEAIDQIMNYLAPKVPSLERSAKRVKIDDDNLGEHIFKDEATKDFTIVGGGAKVKCHKLVLKARSNWFATMLQNAEMAEAQSRELKLNGLTEWGVNHLVRFLYGMEIPATELTPDYALELLQNGHAYELTELVQNIANFLLGKRKEWFEKEEDADALLELYFFTQIADEDGLMQTLNNHLLKVMSLLPSKNISKSHRFQELSKKEAVDLLRTLHDVVL